MLRISKITDIHSPKGEAAIGEAQEIVRSRFPDMPETDIDKLAVLLDNPFKYGFVSQLLVAEGSSHKLKAIAVLLYEPAQRFAWLEIISTASTASSGGLGMALYERVREEAREMGAEGLYFECLPDEPELSPDEKIRKENIARLRFYERYGARPILGTAYETPIGENDTDAPYLVFDGLGKNELPKAKKLKVIVRIMLERKYADRCSPEYIDKVAASIRDANVRLREARYVKARNGKATAPRSGDAIPLVVNDKHEIHHIREHGYVEAPVRISAILNELDKTDLFQRMEPKKFAERHIRETHDGALVDYIKQACAEAPLKKSVYPYVFPVRNPARKPKERSVLAGYWCIDTFTPINRNAYPAARRAVDCALTAAEQIADGARAAYALIRPPGHHAEYKSFGGFCYFCNAAVAAQYLTRSGRVAILDIDYHHGNGQQDIFYARDDVLTVSVHGHPSFAYPYFTGFKDEVGRGPGAGYNLNIPLAETITPEQHREAVAKALKRVAAHKPDFLIVALGLDTAKDDPTGTWSNKASDFRALGKMIGEAGFPNLVIQEGGYRIRTLGINARNFFTGLTEGMAKAPAKKTASKAPKPKLSVADLSWRNEVRESDAEAIRSLVARTDMFTSEEVAIAGELVEERTARGRISGYDFVVGESDGRIIAYACYGIIPGTEDRYDLYWIAVDRDLQGKGAGKEAHARVEQAVREAGGTRLYADTSSREQYAPTRRFYRTLGYRKAAEMQDFYREGDGKVIFMKELV